MRSQLSLSLGLLAALALGTTAVAQTATKKAAPAKSGKAAPAAAAKPDRIMSIDELRVCMKLQQTNQKNGAEITQAQDDFKRDQASVRAEQTEVRSINEAQRAKLGTLTTERDASSAAVTDLNTRTAAAKTDEDRAALAPERAKLKERNDAFEKNLDQFNATQESLRTRIEKLNERIDDINKRSETINERVEPHTKSVAQWREQCGNRCYREEDEIAIKKELAAGK